MTLEELKVVITAETAGLKNELEKVKKQVSKFTKDVEKSSNQLSGLFKTLFKGISVAAIVKGLISISKQSLKAASDLEEVQNVVDVSFGNMAGEVQKFADQAMAAYGISEYEAKKLASTYMAMSKSIGVAINTSKDMSLSLTGLAADMSSFYNVSLETASNALEGIFTGNTRALRQFGIVLSESSLEEFRLAEGIKTSYQNMSEAAKVQLRYQYVMKATGDAQGDYARTANSWANQVKLLTNQWTQLKTELGAILQTVVKPLLIGLNKVLSVIIQVVKAIRAVFGIKAEVSGGAVAANDMAAGFENAATSAEKLQRTLIGGFDELNTLSSSSGDNAGAGLIGGGFDIGEFTSQFSLLDSASTQLSDKMMKIATTVKGVIDNIRGWTQLLWNDSLQPLWNSIKDMFTNLGGLLKEVSPAIMPVITFVLEVVGNWAKVIVDFINDMIANIRTICRGLIDFIGGVFTGDWSRAWEGIKQIFKGFVNVFITMFEHFANIIPKGINGIIKGLNSVVNKVGSKIGLDVNIPELRTISLPRLANGGVITSPTIAMMGEYAGAHNNPEIVTPQSLLRETVESSNSEVISVLTQLARQMISVIEDKDLTVDLDGVSIAKSVNKANEKYRRMTGKPLLAY